ncbi:hypothetical protein CDD81_3367 [Ophiocordyceps australis]|uniref:PLD phosphodiesterase domain-containing protein n=1 Tax=Ophiocordyceps australis TaxID=1399860 RepID=A0A2C5X797_9HYPO|nr:hypothetical protein CDD81_3367 [Ophiocordyceps australis]
MLAERPAKRQRTRGNGAFDALPRSISPPVPKTPMVVKSPWQLTWVRDVPVELNHDAVSIKDLLGDPLISECWQFNFLFDIDFLMEAFDADTQHLVKVHIVHGFWKREDPNRILLMQEAAKFSNVNLHEAPMPEMFGTHHSKMMVLFRHDDTAQVIIHTANMIAKDWTNMTNAVWRSRPLPKLPDGCASATPANRPLGSGCRFKSDLLEYLESYDRRKPVCRQLAGELRRYDFSSVQAALVASVPGKHAMGSSAAWGWTRLKSCLHAIDCAQDQSEIVVQVSSIATLGSTDDWLQKTLFEALASTSSSHGCQKRPVLRLVFPTANEIRESIDGYVSGGSIHTKIQSPQQAKQLTYMRPLLHHWANDSRGSDELNGDTACIEASMEPKDGGRARAAPHIKTYIRYSCNGSTTIDWALLTSANLSRQAWGEAVKRSGAAAEGEVRIASWEIGVLVWPALYGHGSVMVGTFRSDNPSVEPWTERLAAESTSAIVGLRIPYSMPLRRYGSDEVPWVVSMSHSQPDCRGRVWKA